MLIQHFRLLFLGLVAFLVTGAAQAQGYRIQPGDVISVEVLEDESLNRSVLVAPDGIITMPLAGSLSVSGRTLSAIQSDLAARFAPNFSTAPTVVVSLSRVAPREPVIPQDPAPVPVVSIFALGEVAQAGRVELAPGTKLLQALAQIGGFSDFAAVKRIQLRRYDPQTGTEMIYPLNYEAIMSGRSQNGQVIMQEGDVILVPTRRLFE